MFVYACCWSYVDVCLCLCQGVIEGRDDIQWPAIEGTYTQSDIKETIRVLQRLASHLRGRRVREGALRIDLPRLAFNMDWKTRTPIGFRVYELKESNRLIEEFMLLANTRVARKIYNVFPDIAVLRSHPPPNILKLKQLSESLETLGIHLDASSSKTLQESLLRYGQAGTDPISLGRNLVISNLLAKPMQVPHQKLWFRSILTHTIYKNLKELCWVFFKKKDLKK